MSAAQANVARRAALGALRTSIQHSLCEDDSK